MVKSLSPERIKNLWISTNITRIWTKFSLEIFNFSQLSKFGIFHKVVECRIHGSDKTIDSSEKMTFEYKKLNKAYWKNKFEFIFFILFWNKFSAIFSKKSFILKWKLSFNYIRNWRKNYILIWPVTILNLPNSAMLICSLLLFSQSAREKIQFNTSPVYRWYKYKRQ